MRRRCEHCGHVQLSKVERLLRDTVKAWVLNGREVGIAEVVKRFKWSRAAAGTMLKALVDAGHLRRRMRKQQNKFRPERWVYD